MAVVDLNILSTLDLKTLLGYSPTTWLHDVLYKDGGSYYYLPGFIRHHVPEAIRIKKVGRDRWAFVYPPPRGLRT